LLLAGSNPQTLRDLLPLPHNPLTRFYELIRASSRDAKMRCHGARQLLARGRVVVLIGRPGSIPSVPAGSADHGRNWQRFDIDIDPPTPSTPPP
jgi:hypothetical protein